MKSERDHSGDGNGQRGAIQGAKILSAPRLEGAGAALGPLCCQGRLGMSEDLVVLGRHTGLCNQALGAPRFPLNPHSPGGLFPGPPGGGSHLTVPPIGQLQGLDVLKRDALLQQDAAQVRRWELREDVGDIWGGWKRVVSRPAEGPQAEDGLGVPCAGGRCPEVVVTT